MSGGAERTPERCDGCGVTDATVVLRNVGSVYCAVCTSSMALRDAYLEELARPV